MTQASAQTLNSTEPLPSLDMVFHAPSGFDDFRVMQKNIRHAIAAGGKQLWVAKISEVKNNCRAYKIGDRSVLYTATDVNNEKFSFGFWALQAEPNSKLTAGMAALIYGTPVQKGQFLNVTSPQFIHPSWRGKIRPIYPGANRQTPDEIRQAVTSIIHHHLDEAAFHFSSVTGIYDEKMSALSHPFNWGVKEFLMHLHTPGSAKDAHVRAVDICKQIEVGYLLSKSGVDATSQKSAPDSALILPANGLKKLCEAMPFGLTGDQAQAVIEIIQDLESDRPAHRLINGDVGSGKTITFILPAALAAISGYYSAILAPNTGVARQIQNEITSLWPEIPCSLYIEDQKPPITAGGMIAVGTTALFSALKDVAIALLVIDEEHRFGTAQREQLASPCTNVLSASATPIPRSLAKVITGISDVSIIKQQHANKQIENIILTQRDMPKMADHIRKALLANEQVAIVYAKREETDSLTNDDSIDSGSDNATQMVKRNPARVYAATSAASELKIWLNKTIGHEYAERMRIAHGDMTADEKSAAIEDMKSGKANLLITTSLIEVGLTIPGLKHLIVVNAERFGASTLHQLRGRLARNGGSATFIMFSPAELENAPMLPDDAPVITTSALARLQAVAQNSDGFYLSEVDMHQRGVGSLLAGASQQSGNWKPAFFKKISISVEDLMRHAHQINNSNTISQDNQP